MLSGKTKKLDFVRHKQFRVFLALAAIDAVLFALPGFAHIPALGHIAAAAMVVMNAPAFLVLGLLLGDDLSVLVCYAGCLPWLGLLSYLWADVPEARVRRSGERPVPPNNSFNRTSGLAPSRRLTQSR